MWRHIEKVYLVDHAIHAFVGQGGSEEGERFCPVELSEAVARADALIVAAPVYWGDINGLTKDFMDSVRLPLSQGNGLPALGAAIAGGSGKGLLSGVQSIYHWFITSRCAPRPRRSRASIWPRRWRHGA